MAKARAKSSKTTSGKRATLPKYHQVASIRRGAVVPDAPDAPRATSRKPSKSPGKA